MFSPTDESTQSSDFSYYVTRFYMAIYVVNSFILITFCKNYVQSLMQHD